MKVTIYGHLGADAEVKYTADATAYTNFNVAENVGWGDKKRTQWLKCTLWGDRAQKLAQYLTKGAAVVVFGDGEMVEWEDKKSGEKRKSFECRVSDVILAGGGKGKSETGDSSTKAKASEPSQKPIDFGDDDISIDGDDIPF